jgi:hypothetical protein
MSTLVLPPPSSHHHHHHHHHNHPQQTTIHHQRQQTATTSTNKTRSSKFIRLYYDKLTSTRREENEIGYYIHSLCFVNKLVINIIIDNDTYQKYVIYARQVSFFAFILENIQYKWTRRSGQKNILYIYISLAFLN